MLGKKGVDEAPPMDMDVVDGEELHKRVQASKRRLEAIEIERVLYKKSYSEECLGLEKALLALETLHSMQPRDDVEKMIIIQMIGCHEASVECFERASVPGQYPEAMDLHLKNAVRLSNCFVKLVHSLNRYRGKGHQKVTVEHVHVEAGGQAIVGNIEARES